LLTAEKRAAEQAANNAVIEYAESENRRLAMELEHKNRELTNLALKIIEKSELIDKLTKEMSPAGERHTKLRVTMESALDKDRDEFLAYIQQVNEGFFLRLAERHGELTHRQSRLAALLRLRFSSKEIASLMNISPGSVDTYRYQLRQRMGLAPEENLADYLNKI
jgi:DNA-binding NarL/FixJ family response regulator